MCSQRTDNHDNKLTLLLAVAVLVVGLTGASSLSRAADATSLLEQSQASAAQLRRDAVEMETFTRSNMSWQSHAQQIDRIKEHVNRSGQILSQLHDARSEASHAQQEAIDWITPLLQEIASNTTAIINHLSEHQGRTWTPGYQDLVRDNARLATELSGAITDVVDYGRTKARIDELEQKLGFGTS